MAKVLRTGQVAEILGLKTRRVSWLAKKKRLPTLERLGGEGYYFYPADQIMELKERDAPEESPPEEREARGASPVLGRPEETAEGKPKQPKKAPAISSVPLDEESAMIDRMVRALEQIPPRVFESPEQEEAIEAAISRDEEQRQGKQAIDYLSHALPRLQREQPSTEKSSLR